RARAGWEKISIRGSGQNRSLDSTAANVQYRSNCKPSKRATPVITLRAAYCKFKVISSVRKFRSGVETLNVELRPSNVLTSARVFLSTSQPGESGQNSFGAEAHTLQDFLFGQATGRDVQHELLRADGVHVIIDSLDTFVRSAPHRHDVGRLFCHHTARLFGLG